MIISERIFYVMEQKKISQSELSRRTSISVKNISDWKRKKTNPNAESLLPICNALDITPRVTSIVEDFGIEKYGVLVQGLVGNPALILR